MAQPRLKNCWHTSSNWLATRAKRRTTPSWCGRKFALRLKSSGRGAKNSILTKTEAIQKSYAPDLVKEAVRAASAVLARFDAESEDVIDKLGKRADRVSRNLLLRTAFWGVITTASLAFTGWVVVKYVPSLTEIADRRAGLESLKDQITAESGKLESLKNRLILGSDGRRYVPYRDPVKLCGDNNRQETCALYAPVE